MNSEYEKLADQTALGAEEFEKLRLFILGYVLNGVKSTDLIMHMASKYPELDVTDHHNIISAMIECEDIVEIEYVLPHLEFRIKKFLLPKDTKFTKKSLHTIIEKTHGG